MVAFTYLVKIPEPGKVVIERAVEQGEGTPAEQAVAGCIVLAVDSTLEELHKIGVFDRSVAIEKDGIAKIAREELRKAVDRIESQL